MNWDTGRPGLSVGVDVGGTFTDGVVMRPTGEMFRAKALTTPGRHVDGIMNALKELAGQTGFELEGFLRETEHLSVGTTVVTNAIAELKGRRVALLVTKGFRDTLAIAKSPRIPTVDPFVQEAMPTIVPRGQIVEIDERIDVNGSVVVRLSPEQAVGAVRELREQHDIEAVAVCYLWSFLNPAHEIATRDAIVAAFPDLYVTTSSDLYPVIREYERMVTTVLNAFVSGVVVSYAEVLDRRLQEAGFRGRVYLGQSLGGVLDPEEASARPLHLFNSGPVGGVGGAVELASQLEIPEFITADMGGTSYDVSLVRHGRAEVTHRAVIDRFETGLSQLDITPVGAGGGSICWIDERGAPRVGPHSAGSDPGPACYGQGGELPTVTDVAVVLGLVDGKHFLGGHMDLDADAARQAVLRSLAPLGETPEQIAGEMHRIIVQSMIQVVRGASIRRGRDPRGIAMFSFGGASALFAADICRGAGIPRIVIPEFASVFSAWGLLRAEPIRTEARSVQWLPETDPLDRLNETVSSLTDLATANMAGRGFADSEVTVEHTVDMRFSGQSFDVPVALPAAHLDERQRGELLDAFRARYSELYGEGSVWDGFPPLVTTVRAVATASRRRGTPEGSVGSGSETRAVDQRRVFEVDEGAWEVVPVYETGSMEPGFEVSGPCIVENHDTTIQVPRDCTITRAENFRGFVLEIGGAA